MTALQTARSDAAIAQVAPATKRISKDRALYLEARQKISELEKENAKLKKQPANESVFQLSAKLALHTLSYHLRFLTTPDVEHSPFNSGLIQDCHATWAMSLVATRLEQMLATEYTTYSGFDADLHTLNGVAICAQNMLSDKETVYWRRLDAFIKSIDTFAEMCDLANMHGESFWNGGRNV